jgi:hypothetical protein
MDTKLREESFVGPANCPRSIPLGVVVCHSGESRSSYLMAAFECCKRCVVLLECSELSIVGATFVCVNFRALLTDTVRTGVLPLPQ